jgi:hypothetical protein
MSSLVPTTIAVTSLGGHGDDAVLVNLATGLGSFFRGTTGVLVLSYIGVVKGLSGALGVVGVEGKDPLEE